MLNNSNQYGALIWNPNLKTKFEFKSRKKKKKTEKEKGKKKASQARPARPAPASPTGLPTLPVFPARAWPMSRPSASPTPAHPSASLAATIAGPRMSATPVYSVVFLTHASTAYVTGARQRL